RHVPGRHRSIHVDELTVHLAPFPLLGFAVVLDAVRRDKGSVGRRRRIGNWRVNEVATYRLAVGTEQVAGIDLAELLRLHLCGRELAAVHLILSLALGSALAHGAAEFRETAHLLWRQLLTGKRR